ncbi:hypothetical protein B566_EDAN002706 [Ephemera danica]|nr:hypothetical protein B566_EDAN002706 [Ephemera danica]
MNTMGLPSRTLTINMPGMVVRLLQNKKLVVNAETITSLPFQQLNFKVWLASSKYILAQLPNGIEIQWDGTTIANIFIPPTLFGEMQGLLGQYNGMKNELYLTSDGEYTNSSTVFVESWRVDQEYQCIVPRNTKSSTNCTLQSIPSNIETFCNKIYGPTFTGTFVDCNKLIENTTTLSYYEVCVLEACACDSITCSCPVLSNYASQCKNNHGLNMGNWVFPECVTTCPEGQSYQYCRSSCSTSCSSQAMHPKCKTECVEGCNCPEGQSVDNSGKCINSTQCSCFYNGIAYNNNAKMVRPSGNVDADICTCKESTWVCEKQSWVTCSSWGDPAYRTFDGQTFLFQGRSSYTLVQHSDFIIEATNKKRGQGSVTESLTIRINGMKIELLQNSQLRVDGKKINKLPWEKVGVIKVYKTSHAHSSAVELHNHVKIDWDGKTRFTISLPGILYGTVKGLCGTFNGNETDDFEMPSGDLASSWDNFGNSWKVDPNLPPEITNPHPCDNDETLAKQAEEYCSSIKKGEFKKCHSHLKPDAFYESCRFDVCVLENSTSVCPHFASYDYECRKKNVVLDWIHDVEQCSVTCPAGQEYKLCGNLCTRSCRDISFNTECDSFCVEGCYCPDGKTLDDYGKCVALTSCNCYYNGIKYQNGKEITQLDLNGDPQRCKCDKGNWTCSPIPDATCSGFGDPHYITFDGARYDFQGSCKYYLLWNNQFAVIGENRPCSVGSHVTCTKSVTVRIMGGIEIQLLQGKTVILNGTTVATLPVVEDNFEIRMHSGYWVEVLLWNGVKINYNGFHEFSITVPGTFYGKTEGLCGTFNGNKNDEYRTSYGNYVNKSSINEFGDSWRTESCNGTGNYQHPCELNPTISTQKCDALNGNIFKDCHSLVPVDTFFDSCKYDLCAGGGSEELCAAMMTYAAECASHGAIIDWRKHVGECSKKIFNYIIFKSLARKDKQHCTEKDDDSKENSSEESSEESSEDNDDREEGSCGSNDKNDEIELCTCVSGKWSCKKQEGARCSVAEDKHFKTFDKRKYDFVGKCGYILLQTTNTSIETALQRCSETRKKDSCTSGIIIKHNNIKISLSSPDEVRFNGLKINRFPYKYDGVEIRKSGSKYFVTLTDGIEIQWDGPKKNYIDVPGRFFASTKGLCGNFNNIKDDDLQIDGKIVSNVYDFVNSWKVDESCGVAIPPSPPCEANSTIQSAAKNYCNGIYNNEFSECHGAVDVEPFYSNCVDDVCSCDGDIECRCTMLGMYADECSEMGIHVNWRQRNQCGGYCAAGQEFQVCGDSCALTCRDVQLNSNCKSKCVEGCRCPRGKILNDYGICIPLESCSCIYNDREYSQGDTIVKQQGVDTSEICQCGEGRWTCRDQNNGVCSAINNKYISTFNGINFNASKLCSYYLMKIPGFSVVSTSGHCSQQGLCGSFSDDDTDLITRWGTVTEDTTEFAKSWQVNDVCQPEEEIVNKCENSTIRQYAENLCQPLLNIIGFACSEVVDALLYYENCMESVCTGNTSESDVCYIFSIYADECAANGIIVDWRKRIPSCIYQCQNQEVYERCSSSQFRTCRDLSLPPNNINTCFEGCNCPHGFLLDDSQQCVPMIECSCYSDGQSYSAGESVIKTSNNNVEK